MKNIHGTLRDVIVMSAYVTSSDLPPWLNALWVQKKRKKQEKSK